MSKDSPSAFFVGYKTMPATLKRFYVPVVGVLLVLTAFVGHSIASHQKHQGHGVWNSAEKVTYEGVLSVDPYPILHRADDAEQENTQSIMLVMVGKHSANAVSTEFAGKHVSVTGFAISRGGWRMLEIEAATDIQALDREATDAPASDALEYSSLGDVTLSGEIVDSKCFLGVMKPGGGPIHKACAEMCLLGGIPPMLVVRDEQDRKFGYLLTASNHASAAESLSSLAAEPVEIRGELMQQGDMLYIKMADDGIKLL